MRKGVIQVTITIYTKTGCPYCKAAKESFAQKNINQAKK